MINLSKKQLLLSTLLAGGVITTAAPSYAQDSGDNAMDEITVTGTNIPRPISDAPQPITLIDSVDIELSGISTVTDVLRTGSFNSFGSYRARSGSSFGQIATVDLKGIGPEYTAVLINGRRVPGSPLTGASIVDLNTIPLSAVDNIQVLKDSASAIYGADAIGGVVSITLKDDFEGFEIGGGIERPTLPGADTEKFHALYGKTFDRGNIMIGYEHFERKAISDGDRDYSKADTSGPTFNDTEGVSVGGNTGFETDFSNPFPLGDCDPSIYAGVFTNAFGLGGSGCGFAYANISLQTGNVERDSLFLTSSYELADDAEFYLDARWNNNKTFGRYAPAVGFFSFPATSPFNTLGRDIDAFHRFVGHGNRDDSVDVEELTLSTGLRGELGNGMNYDMHMRYFDYSGDELGNTYVRRSILEEEVEAGNYDVFNPLSQDPVHLAAVERSGLQLSRALKTKDIEVGVTLNGELGQWELGGGKIGWAVGGEVAKQEYTDVYDEFREALDVLGSAGNSAQGDRKRYAAFAEVRVPVLENFEVNLAGRYDDYDDVGNQFTPQINARYEVSDNLVLRGSWGKGFKAPNLIDLHQELAESFDPLKDEFRCNAQGIPLDDCGTAQVQNFSGGNLELKSEKSESFSLGAVGDFGNLSASIDYYNVEITDQVSSLSLRRVNDREIAGDIPPGVIINRGPTVGGVPGAIIDIINPSTNSALVETSGIDIGVNYGFTTDFGDFDLNGTYVKILDYNLQATVDDDVEKLAGDIGYPEDRFSTSLRYSRDDVTLTWNTSYIDSHKDLTEDATSSYDSWMGHDVTMRIADLFGHEGVDLTAGVLNVFAEKPSIDSVDGYDAGTTLELYEVRGSVPFVNLKYRFGG